MTQPAKNYGPIQTFLAGAAITANKAVKLSAANTVVHTTAITDDVAGVALQTVASGEYVDVQTMGKAKVRTSAAVNAMAQVMPTAAGDGECSTAAGATAKSFGIANSASGGTDGEVVEVLLRLGVNTPANT